MQVISLITDGVVYGGEQYEVAYRLDDQYVVVWVGNDDLYTISFEDIEVVE